MIKKNFWHNLSWEEVVKHFNSDAEKGLSEKEVKSRKGKFGKNLIEEKKPPAKLKIFLNQFKSPLIYILIFVGIAVLILEEYPQNLIESSFVFVAIFINALFGSWQENKASQAFEKLKKILKTKTVVIRDGNKKEVFQEELIPGDIVILTAGDKVPADGRLIEAKDLKISEAVLTGEWLPAAKKTEILPKETPLADRDNMVYVGCLVEGGEGKAIITATGKETEMGKIALLLKETEEEKTPLQKRLAGFGKLIGAAIIFICLFIFIGGVLKKQNPIEMFETAAAIAVGGIPEALPVVMTLILVLGMERLAKRRGLVRKLTSVETLGSTSVILSDKTKTLTQGKMKADQVVVYEGKFRINLEEKNPVFLLALKIAALANEAFIENPKEIPGKWKIGGRPTDKALLLAGAEAGILKTELEKKSLPIQKLPFDSSRKYQTSLHQENGKLFLYLSGAPERLLKISKKIQLKDSVGEIGSQELEKLNQELENLTQKGSRVIGVGYREIELKDKEKKIEELLENTTFVGFITLKDPLRPGAKEAIQTCKKAGLIPVIITGDHRSTAKTIAQELGMEVEDENIIEGEDLDKISDKELEEKVRKIKIYARAEPRHKMRIVRAWQSLGEVVAMTGDGVNDAPAIKKADIGVALGSGTEVAKEASDLVLLNDSFEIIVKAIEQGRTILDNLRKAIAYILADSFTSVVLVGMSIIFGWPLPILWAQILWNNLVEDTLPNIAHAFEPKEKGVMERGPNPPQVPLLTEEMKVLIFGAGLIDEFLTLFLFWVLWAKFAFALDYVRTMVFGAICLDTAFVVFCYKNLRKNIWEIDLFDNKLLLLSSLVVFATFAVAIYLSPLQRLLHTVPLGIGSWLILIGVGIISMFLIEITKWYFIVRHKTEQ